MGRLIARVLTSLLIVSAFPGGVTAQPPTPPLSLQQAAGGGPSLNADEFRALRGRTVQSADPTRSVTVELDPALIEPPWELELDPVDGLRLWDCVVIALENNLSLKNVREDLREAFVTLRERNEEFGNIYSLGAGAHFDEGGAPSPIARNDLGLDRDRWSISFGGLENDGTFLSRRFANGGTLALGAQTYYNSQTATRVRPFLDPNGNPILDGNGDPSFIARQQDVRWFSEAGLTVTQPLLEGAGNIATTELRLSQLTKANRVLSLELEIQTLISQVVNDYLQVLLRISLVQVSQRSYDRAVEFFTRTVMEDREYIETKKREEGVEVDESKPGAVPPVTLVRTEQQITANQQGFIGAKNDVETALINLRLTLGLEPSTRIVLAATESPFVRDLDFSIGDAIEYGLLNRPDLKSFEIFRRQADLGLAVAENALLPNLDLNWRMSFREQGDDLFESFGVFDYQQAGADLRLALPLNLPSDRANYERAQIGVRQSFNDYELRKRSVVNEVDNAYRAEQTLDQRIAVLRRNEELAKETYEKLLGQYAFGGLRGLDPFDVARAQDDWAAAESDRVRAEINYVIASSLLDRAMGRPISDLYQRYAPLGAEFPPEQ